MTQSPRTVLEKEWKKWANATPSRPVCSTGGEEDTEEKAQLSIAGSVRAASVRNGSPIINLPRIKAEPGQGRVT